MVYLVCSAGATRDLGFGLTRFCLRHRNLEGKMRTLCRYDLTTISVNIVTMELDT